MSHIADHRASCGYLTVDMVCYRPFLMRRGSLRRRARAISYLSGADSHRRLGKPDSLSTRTAGRIRSLPTPEARKTRADKSRQDGTRLPRTTGSRVFVSSVTP